MNDRGSQRSKTTTRGHFVASAILSSVFSRGTKWHRMRFGDQIVLWQNCLGWNFHVQSICWLNFHPPNFYQEIFFCKTKLIYSKGKMAHWKCPFMDQKSAAEILHTNGLCEKISPTDFEPLQFLSTKLSSPDSTKPNEWKKKMWASNKVPKDCQNKTCINRKWRKTNISELLASCHQFFKRLFSRKNEKSCTGKKQRFQVKNDSLDKIFLKFKKEKNIYQWRFSAHFSMIFFL